MAMFDKALTGLTSGDGGGSAAYNVSSPSSSSAGSGETSIVGNGPGDVSHVRQLPGGGVRFVILDLEFSSRR